MRNPERIEPMLEAIGHLWSSMPDLRLGQLMVVLAGKYDLFNIEDEDMMQLIEGSDGLWNLPRTRLIDLWDLWDQDEDCIHIPLEWMTPIQGEDEDD